jgi:hypothetical protein
MENAAEGGQRNILLQASKEPPEKHKMEMLAQNNVFTEQGGYSERKKWTRQ